jgi:hypothetical protein
MIGKRAWPRRAYFTQGIRNEMGKTMATNVGNRLKAGASAAADQESLSANKDQRHPVDDLVDYVVSYAREKPEVAALWCLGIGFVLGWKLKPW